MYRKSANTRSIEGALLLGYLLGSFVLQNTIIWSLYNKHISFCSEAQDCCQITHTVNLATWSTMKFSIVLAVAACLIGMLVTATPVKTIINDENYATIKQTEKIGQIKKMDVSRKCCTTYGTVSVCEECPGWKEEGKQSIKTGKDERCCLTSETVLICHDCSFKDDVER